MPLNIAIAGTGSIVTDQLLPALNQVDGVQLWSILSRDATRATRIARAYHATSPHPGHTHLERLLADPQLDALVIATPDKLHAQAAIAAAAAGKHVLVEKPMAADVKSAAAMVAAGRQNAVVLAVAYHLRWHAGHRKVFQTVRDGRLGQIRHMRMIYTFQTPNADNWRATPDIGRWWSLAAVGTHCLDAIRWIMGPSCGVIVGLQSTISNAAWQSPHDETAIVALKFESGATAEFCSSVQFQAPSRLEVYGSTGYAICEDTLGRGGTGTVRTHQGEVLYTPVNPYAGEIADFAAAIREGRPPEVDGQEGLRNVELLAAAFPDPECE